jgi:hypothetical protein
VADPVTVQVRLSMSTAVVVVLMVCSVRIAGATVFVHCWVLSSVATRTRGVPDPL